MKWEGWFSICQPIVFTKKIWTCQFWKSYGHCFFFNKNVHSRCFDFPSKAQLIFLLSCGTYKRHLFICLYNLFWFTIRVLQASMKRGYTITYCYILTYRKSHQIYLVLLRDVSHFLIELCNEIEKQKQMIIQKLWY